MGGGLTHQQVFFDFVFTIQPFLLEPFNAKLDTTCLINWRAARKADKQTKGNVQLHADGETCCNHFHPCTCTAYQQPSALSQSHCLALFFIIVVFPLTSVVTEAVTIN